MNLTSSELTCVGHFHAIVRGDACFGIVRILHNLGHIPQLLTLKRAVKGLANLLDAAGEDLLCHDFDVMLTRTFRWKDEQTEGRMRYLNATPLLPSALLSTDLLTLRATACPTHLNSCMSLPLLSLPMKACACYRGPQNAT